MKSVRWVFLLSGIITIVSLGFVAYQVFWGPDHIQLAGRSLPQLLKSGDLISLLVIPGVLIISTIAIIPFLRIIFPAEIKDGLTTQAKVLRVWDTGVSINDNPQVGLSLEYSPLGSGPLQVEAKSVVSRLNAALVQPGVTAEIKYDPQKPERVQILSLNIEDRTSLDASSRLEELNDLYQKKLINEEEYQQKREEIIKNI